MPETATSTPRLARLNFAKIDERCAELGATTDEERAKLLHTGRVSLWRWRNGHADPGIDRAARLAEMIGLTLADITIADPPKPSTPPPGPKPPAGPGAPRPPAGPPREGAQ